MDKQSLLKLPDSRTLFVGDDTGLLKQLKMTVSIEQDIISQPAIRKKKYNKRAFGEMEQGEENKEEEVKEEHKEEAVIRNRADISFKVVNKFGKQAKDEGILYLQWSLKGNNNNDYASYLRGKSNVVQVFDTKTSHVFAEKEYKSLQPIKGLGALGADIFNLSHIIVDEKGKLIVDKAQQSVKKHTFEAETNSKKVVFMTQSPFNDKEVLIGSKDTLLMLWDVSQATKKPKWQARNLPNDELDLQIPIFDTDGCFIDKNHLCVTTAFGNVREYDTRGQRRPTINTKITSEDDMLLNKIIKSKANDNNVYVTNQEGHVYMLDRRKNYNIAKKLMGNKGTVRALASFICKADNIEYVVSAGCDRFVRIFNPNCDYQKDSEIATSYLKQKLNSILISDNLNK